MSVFLLLGALTLAQAETLVSGQQSGAELGKQIQSMDKTQLQTRHDEIMKQLIKFQEVASNIEGDEKNTEITSQDINAQASFLIVENDLIEDRIAKLEKIGEVTPEKKEEGSAVGSLLVPKEEDEAKTPVAAEKAPEEPKASAEEPTSEDKALVEEAPAASSAQVPPEEPANKDEPAKKTESEELPAKSEAKAVTEEEKPIENPEVEELSPPTKEEVP